MYQSILERTRTGNAGNAEGREAIKRNGERLYLNHQPCFRVHYDPTGKVERLVYALWENEIHAWGSTLLPYYEMLKANATDILRESEGPRDADLPYIDKIKFVQRL